MRLILVSTLTVTTSAAELVLATPVLPVQDTVQVTLAQLVRVTAQALLVPPVLVTATTPVPPMPDLIAQIS